jgi:predicted AlkP superfamily pyrophosphatase or phosphodiesterase
LKATLVFPLFALTLACGEPAAEQPTDATAPPGTPVVLITIDTLRADRLPAYGYAGVATPAIDAFRRDAILFECAYSHVPLTLPSHTSLLTGLRFFATAVTRRCGFRSS